MQKITYLAAVFGALGAQAGTEPIPLVPLGPSVQQLCGDAKDLKKIERVRELEASIIQVCTENSSRAQVIPLANDALAILRSLPGEMSLEDGAFDPRGKQESTMNALTDKLNLLADAIRSYRRKSSYEAPKSALGNRLQSLQEEFGKDSPKAQSDRLKDKAAYQRRLLDRLTDTLRMTENGRKALKCWESRPGDPLVGDEIVVAPGGGPTAMYVARSAEGRIPPGMEVIWKTETSAYPQDGKQRFVRRILMNPESDPIELLHTLQHEMTHSCGAVDDCKRVAAYQDASNASNKRLETCCPAQETAMSPACKSCMETEQDKLAQAQLLKDQENLVDECRAYSAQVSFYKELAVADPGLVCNYQYRSGAFNNQVISSGQFQAATEKMLRDGDFGLLMGRDYSLPKGSGIKPQNLFADYVKGGPVPAKLRPELVEKLKAAGCRVR